MKELQVSLYDIFGYLVPGAFSLFATVILYWTWFSHGTPNIDLMTIPSWSLGAVLAYLFGHLTQAIANQAAKLLKTMPTILLTKGGPGSLKSDIIDAAESKAKRLTSIPATTQLSASEIFDVCDHLLLERGKTYARDIYVYREGFYRGVCVSSILIAIAFIIRATYEHNTITNGGQTYDFGQASCFILAALAATSAYLSFNRFRRFGQYHVKMAVLGTLALDDARESTPST